MKNIRVRYLAEVSVVAVVVVSLTASWLGRKESVLGKDEQEILQMAVVRNDYAVAQKLYERELVHGTTAGEKNVELAIYPEKRVAAEIARVEGLLSHYPSYPPLLSQLQKLYTMVGDSEKAGKYGRELTRLNAVTK